MSKLKLTKIRLRNGVWEGRIYGADLNGMPPPVGVRYLDEPVEDVQLTENLDDSCWDLTIPIPKRALADGVHTILVFDETDGEKLGDFCLIAGEVLSDDLRAEVDLLRAELDMLKRAFRRHCLETM